MSSRASSSISSTRVCVLLVSLLLTLGGCSDDAQDPVADLTGGDDADTAPSPDLDDGQDADPTDADAPPDGVTDCGGACGPDEACCRGACVDLAADAAHCGACDAPCGVDEVCQGGACGRPCEGGCHPSEVCSRGLCLEACEEGLVECEGVCADLASDPERCGACDARCLAQEVCADGACAAACGPGTQACGGACVDLDVSRDHCGGCDAPCAAGLFCVDGACAAGVSCEGGLTACLGQCVDPSADVDHCGACGAGCGAGEVCEDGACRDDCTPGYTECAGACVDPDLSFFHCGGCGQACDPGELCQEGACVAACDGGLEACDSACVDLETSFRHCGACGDACGDAQGCVDGACACVGNRLDCDGERATGCEVNPRTDAAHCGACGAACLRGQVCEASACVCAPSFGDCDLDPSNGCEIELLGQQTCVCTPGETRACYTGEAATRGRGLCSDGVETCAPNGVQWGPCEGEVLPALEVCDNGLDENCSGTADDGDDLDGDGWSSCDGDCCDSQADGCGDPAVVSPGGYDFPANGQDDDCNDVVDDAPLMACSVAEQLSGVTGAGLAGAMELCKASTGPDDWGLVSAQVTRASGAGAPNVIQYAILADLGAAIPPQEGATMAVLSSGTARAVGDAGFQDPEINSFSDFSNSGSAPTDYLDEHGGVLEAAAGCPSGDAIVNDSVQLRLVLRAPVNARGFEFDFRFLSSEYPEWLCSEFNDFFLAMLYSGAPGIPLDHNISFDDAGNPISVNNAFFTTCQAQSCGYFFSGTDANLDGCPDSIACNPDGFCSPGGNPTVCPEGTAPLAGYMTTPQDGGATAWLTSRAPVVPGEAFELQLHIWDTTDSSLDSTVLIDNFRWLPQTPSVETER